MDVQLHTHRHRFPLDESLARAEIRDNRAALASLGPGPYVHFCFPSGIYERSQFPWLEKEGIVSATTTRPGFNTPETPLHELDRVLDGERISDLEFEAELCGVLGFLRGRR
jgi:peptidoglycan/xylan/chitin deacetylase (PgdA/CDA1 family)